MIADFKANVDILRPRVADCDVVAGWLGLSRGKPRQRRRWCCPSASCRDKPDPTLSTPKAGGWHCFRCGAKGDGFGLVGLAQGLPLPLRGRDFADVARWLAPYAGVDLDAVDPAAASIVVFDVPDESEAKEPERPGPAAVGAAWDALSARQSADSDAARWLAGRGIPPHLTRSGFAVLDNAMVGALSSAPASLWLARHAGRAIAAPLRSMASGEVVAMQARAFKVDDKAEKRRIVGRLSDDDGSPRAFGVALDTMRVIIVVEGMADTWAAEAMTAGASGIAVVGAADAGSLPKVAAAVHGVAPRVVIVRHLDHPDAERSEQGAGQQKAREALAACPGAVAFPWPAFRRALFALDVETRPTPPGFDLAAALELARGAAADFAAVQRAFLSAIGEAGKLPGLVAPTKTSPRRVSVPPAPPPPATKPVAPVVQTPARGNVDDVVEGRRIARAALADDGWTESEAESLFATIDRLWGAQ